MRRPRAVVAMSGGVDSSVAAALLLQDGYRVEGVSLRLWDSARRDDRVWIASTLDLAPPRQLEGGHSDTTTLESCLAMVLKVVISIMTTSI